MVAALHGAAVLRVWAQRRRGDVPGQLLHEALLRSLRGRGVRHLLHVSLALRCIGRVLLLFVQLPLLPLQCLQLRLLQVLAARLPLVGALGAPDCRLPKVGAARGAGRQACKAVFSVRRGSRLLSCRRTAA